MTQAPVMLPRERNPHPFGEEVWVSKTVDLESDHDSDQPTVSRPLLPEMRWGARGGRRTGGPHRPGSPEGTRQAPVTPPPHIPEEPQEPPRTARTSEQPSRLET